MEHLLYSGSLKRAGAHLVVLLVALCLAGCSATSGTGGVSDTPAPVARTESARVPADTSSRTFPTVLLDDEKQPNSFMGVTVTNFTKGGAYRKGKRVLLAFEMRNHGDESVDIYFPTGQVFDFAVFDETKQVWRFSRHRDFGGKGRLRTVRPGEGEIYRVAWDQKDDYGNPVPEGLYIARGYLMTEPRLQTDEVDIVISE